MLVLGFLSSAALAASQKAPTTTVGWAELLKLMGALIFVVALLFFLAWAYRRWQGVSATPAGAIQILAVRSLSPKERLILVAVGNEQILIGVSPSGIQHLHTLSEPVDITPQNGSFAQVLSAIGMEKKPREGTANTSED